MRRAAWLLLLAALLPAARAELPAPLDRALRESGLPAGGVSVSVQAVDAPTPLLELDAHTPRPPASTIKLVTALAALELLGPTHTWQTDAFLLGQLTDGVLDGDLLFRGGGDPYLTDQALWKFLGTLRQQGLREVRGRLLVDDRRFAPPVRGAAEFDGAPSRLYNVQANALLANFKAFDLHIAPSVDRSRIEVRAEPPLPALLVDNQLVPVDLPCSTGNARIETALPEPDTAARLVLSGRYPVRCGKTVLPRTALQSDTYFDGLFRFLWQQWGGSVDGPLGRAPAPTGLAPFGTWVSPPLAEVIRPMNKWSNNAMADALLLSIAARDASAPATLERGAGAVREWLQASGVEAQGFVMENGSGLSRTSRISTATLVGMLRHGWAGPYMPEFIASLPLVGMDGTARRHFKRGPERGRMHLKSGHLADVVGVGGYVLAGSGRTYAVAVLTQGPSVGNGSGQAFINAVLAWTYRQ